MSISNFGPLQVVNQTAAGTQYQESIAGLASGKILVTWSTNLTTISAQYYDAFGDRIDGEFTLPLTHLGTANEQPRVAAGPDGGFTVAYATVTAGVKNVAFDDFDSDGSSLGGQQKTGAGSDGVNPYVVDKFFGPGHIYAFLDETANGGDIIYGASFASPHTANTAVTGLQTDPDIAVLAGGTRFAISWWDNQSNAVKVRLFDSGLAALTPELTAGATGSGFLYTNGYHGEAVAALNGGNFVVVWNSTGVSSVDTLGYGIQASVFNSNGTPVKLGLQVNTHTPNNQIYASAVGLLDGGFAVAWGDLPTAAADFRIVLRTFDASGNPTSGEFVVDGVGHDDHGPQLTLLADGRIAVTWEASDPVLQDLDPSHVEMQIVDPRGAAVSLSANDVGADLVGTGFNDTFVDGHGDDRFTGHGGFDTVSFSRAVSGVTVNLGLADAQSVGGGMGTDTLAGIHGLVGSSFADLLIGSAGNDTLDGRLGSDTMRGRAGNDIYVVNSGGDVVSESGGAGVDTVRSSVTFGLVPSAHVIGNIEKLTLLGTGNFAGTGNSLANTLIGNVGANIEKGGGGKDLIMGGSGNDRLYGEVGNDTLTGGAGHDRFYFTTALGAANIDHVTDFAHGVDKVYLENAVFKGLPAGGLAATAFHAGTHAADASDRIIYNRPTGALFFDSDGTGAHAQVEFAVLTNKPLLTAGDFAVI